MIDCSIILFARSVDGGKTFEPPQRISTHAGLPRDDNGGLVGFVGVIGADGTVYAIWNDGSAIAFSQSHDGGKTFAASRSVIDVAPPYFGGAGGIPGVSRAMGFPQIGVGRRDGKRAGPLYLSWSDYRNGDVDVFCASSIDHGRTWSKPIRVNNDSIHNGIDQFFQWMAVDPESGDVYVQFYDRRDARPIARRVSLSDVPSTGTKPSSITRGQRAPLRVPGQHFWAITPGWRHTTAKYTVCGLGLAGGRDRTNNRTVDSSGYDGVRWVR